MQPFLIDLASRVEALEGPDREVDIEVGLTIGGWRRATVNGRDMIVADENYHLDDPGSLYPSFTASVDTVLDLIGRELTGWRIRWQCDGDGVNEAFAENKGDFGAIDANDTRAFAVTPALALLAATLRARALLAPSQDQS